MNNNEYNNQYNENSNFSQNNNGMNNNYSNQSNNLNTFHNEFSSDVNTNLNRNNLNNYNNNNNNNLGNQMNHKKNNNNKLIYIVIAIILFIVLIVIIFLPSNNSSNLDSNNILPIISSHKNNTGSTKYKGSDVDYNCVFEKSNDKNSVKSYSDIIFNYKTKGSSGQQYQAYIFSKMIIEYNNVLTDEAYKEFVESLESINCFDSDCTGNHLELLLTTLGWDTVVDRTGNKIVITYYNPSGLGATATKEDMKIIKNTYEKEGFVCK